MTASGGITGTGGGSQRRSLPILSFVLVLSLTATFFMLAQLHPLLSQSGVAVFALSLLFLIAMGVVFAHPNPDPLNPLRLASLICILIYCIAPLMTKEFQWFFVGSKVSLMERASILALGAFICLCVGYTMGAPPRRAGRKRVPARSQAPIVLAGLLLFFVGLAAYLAAFVLAGGFERVIGGGESRVQFFKGFGWLYWAAFLMLPGGALYFAALLSRKRALPWLYAWPLALSFTSFILLQGRFRALRALVCLLILWHYQVRRVRMIRLVGFGTAGFAFFVFVGYARHPEVRPYLLTKPVGVVRLVADNFLEYSQAVVGDDISRIPQVMLAIDAFPKREPYRWGTTLISGMNPVFRLLGVPDLQVANLGTLFFQLARPEYPEWLETGYHTSLLGELLANFPWYFTLPMMALFGALLGVLYRSLVEGERTFLSLVVYSLVLFPILSTLIVGVSLIAFELTVVLIPVLAVRFLFRESRIAQRGPIVPEGHIDGRPEGSQTWR